MSYKELIDKTNKKLEDYSFNDEYYQDIYNKAIERLDSSYREGVKAINAEHKASRTKAVSENALATKSLQQELATRGLARSGESAMLSINQSLALRNTLAELARETLKAKSELVAGFNKDLSSLEKEKADKILSAGEKDKQNLYDRLTHLESLEEGRNQHLETLAANRTEHLESMEADRDKWLADYELELLKEKNRAKEKDRELGLKETAAQEDANGTKNEGAEDDENGTQQLSPELSPDKTASYIVQTCNLDNDYIYGDYAQKRVRHNFAKLVYTMGLSQEYIKEVMHVLCSRGFDGQFDIEVSTGKNFKLIYATYLQHYNDKYNDLVEGGFAKSQAREIAEIVGRRQATTLMDKLNLNDYETKQINKLIWD